MHEFSMTMNLIRYLIELVRNKNARKISEVYIEIGKLTHLNPEQISFLYNTVSSNYPELSDSKLYISRKDAKIRCRECNYTGPLPSDDELPLLIFQCPKCGSGDIEVLEGNEFLVKRVKLVIS